MIEDVLFRTVTLACAAAALVLSACSGSHPSTAPTTTSAADPRTSDPPTHQSTSSSSPHRPSAAQVRAEVTTGIARIIRTEPTGGVSVAEINTATGARFSGGATSGMWTASAYKLLMLVALLRQGGSGSETAAAAIENSDNVAGYSLFLQAGGNPGVQQTVQALGMHHTVLGESDPTFTRTSATDYLKVVEALVRPGFLSADQRAYVLGLMRNVEADQRWGVGVVADKGTHFANKNGWLSIDDSNGPGETDNGLWAVTSVGVVTVHGQQVLMSVFTQHQRSFGAGVALVQKLTRTMIPAVSKA